MRRAAWVGVWRSSRGCTIATAELDMSRGRAGAAGGTRGTAGMHRCWNLSLGAHWPVSPPSFVAVTKFFSSRTTRAHCLQRSVLLVLTEASSALPRPQPGLAGNYTEYVKQKEERSSQQWVAWEKQQKEIARQVRRLALATACTTPSPSVLFAACSAPPRGHPQARPRSSVPADLFRLTRVHQCCWGAQAARAWSRPTAASPAPLLAGRRRR